MRVFYEVDDKELVDILNSGGIAVLRTDTLYGIVARADDEAAVERVYGTKGRTSRKSCIILLSDVEECYGDADELRDEIEKLGHEPTSFLIDSPRAPEWLLRQNNELAYRVPHSAPLRSLLSQTGPLIAPSANPEGEPPARTVDEAKAYFGENVDAYVEGGEVLADTPPSRLVRVHKDGVIERLR